MLRRTPSLTLRAGMIFMSIYAMVLIAILAVAAIANWAEPGSDPHQGARLALNAASEEIRHEEGRIALERDGYFAELARRNPSLWLIGRIGERSFSFGPVPPSAAKLLRDHPDLLDSGRFTTPDSPPGLRGAAFRSHYFGPGTGEGILAAGGVDPSTLDTLDTMRMSAEPIFVLLGAIALLGFLAMLIALPLFTRAVRPIAAEAEALRPQDSERRLDERKAPRELLPLVRGFNAALDRLSSELGRRKRFIADVAHELRTPLAVVSLRVEALKDEEVKAELRNGVGRLSHLVGQMLDLERLSLSGNQRAPVDLAALARDVVADLAPMALKAGYDLSLDAPEGAVIVTGDRHAIERALTNLVGNAIAHGGGAGNIEVVVGADRTIDVKDEGPGVPADLQPRLFEPFSRGGSGVEGSGLGLHLTREIMRAHDGDVRLVPGPRGATFRLTFPPLEDGAEAKPA